MELVGAFVDHLDAHIGEHREQTGQRHRRSPVQLEPSFLSRRPWYLIQVQPHHALVTEFVQVPQVHHPPPRVVVLLVRLGDPPAVRRQHRGCAFVAELGPGRAGQILLPRPGEVDDATIELALIHLRQGVPVGHPDHVVQPGQRCVRDPRGVLDPLPVERLHQQRFDPLAHCCGVPVARDVHQTGHVAPVRVGSQEDGRLAAFLLVYDGPRGPVQRVDIGLEQLVPRVGLQGSQEILGQVTLRREPRAFQYGPDLGPDVRYIQNRPGVGAGGEQAEEAVLAHHLAVGVEPAHADVVQVHGPMHGGHRIRLGHDQHRAFPSPLGHPGRQGRRVPRSLPTVPEQSQAGLRLGLQHVVVPQVIAPVAQEGELTVRQPPQQGRRIRHLGGIDAGRRGVLELVGHSPGTSRHRRPVLHGDPDVSQDPLQPLRQPGPVLLVGHSIHLDVHPGLGGDPFSRWTLVDVGVDKLGQLTARFTTYHHLGVHDQVHRAPLAADFGGDGVDQEGHVIGDHFNDGMTAAPAVVLDGRGEDPHPGRARVAPGRQRSQRQCGAQEVLRTPAEQILGDGVPVALVKQLGALRDQARVCQRRCRLQERRPGLLQRLRHRRSPHPRTSSSSGPRLLVTATGAPESGASTESGRACARGGHAQ